MDHSLSDDYSDMLSIFNEEQVEYLLVGAWALGFHAARRYTEDIDLWVRASPENARRVLHALKRFGAPLHGLTEAEFVQPRWGLQIGVPPIRIDILTTIDGVEFEEAWQNKITVELASHRVHVIGRQELMRNKAAAGRPKDLNDLDWLKRYDGT